MGKHPIRLRVERADTEERFNKIVDHFGSTGIEVVSRLIKWCAREDDSIQLALFHNSDEATREMILRSLAKKKPVGGE
jgi:hypothetical protein